jgi:hypothetical protein
LKEFSFSISSAEAELYKYKSDSTIKNLLGFDIPPTIGFHSSDQYFLNATEINTPEISAECTVPEYPSNPELASFSFETTTLPEPTKCWGIAAAKTELIDFTFNNNSNKELYYAILLEGYGTNFNSSIFSTGRSQLEFGIRDCNAPGFFAELIGFKRGQWTCILY